MRTDRVGLHTVRSHGVSLVRKHWHDWLMLVVLGVLELILYVVIPPFHRFIRKDTVMDLRYPLKDSTIPFWVVPMYSVVLPILIFLAVYIRRRDVYDLHHAILGILFAALATGVVTDTLKDAAGRPRPDFFWRCFPDGKDVYDLQGSVLCHGNSFVVREGYKSFPSGHTSWSFAGLGFLSLYLAGKMQVFDNRGHGAKLCIVLLPIVAASLVAISLVNDYWHHWQDVVAGGLIGIMVGTFFYLQYFPPPYHADGWGPYAYFRELEMLGNGVNQSNDMDLHNGRPVVGGDVESGRS